MAPPHPCPSLGRSHCAPSSRRCEPPLYWYPCCGCTSCMSPLLPAPSCAAAIRRAGVTFASWEPKMVCSRVASGLITPGCLDGAPPRKAKALLAVSSESNRLTSLHGELSKTLDRLSVDPSHPSKPSCGPETSIARSGCGSGGRLATGGATGLCPPSTHASPAGAWSGPGWRETLLPYPHSSWLCRGGSRSCAGGPRSTRKGWECSMVSTEASWGRPPPRTGPASHPGCQEGWDRELGAWDQPACRPGSESTLRCRCWAVPCWPVLWEYSER
mmetsp:Transcript_5334/g.11708  ORF Transcript_5334/g.11708 Transcript_5334/m.11708 type:complete len:272 (+) Transcript_5334:162-977(+)